jgi:type I restriction enzyme R subunit
MIQDKTPHHIRLDERNHVEKPLLDQLAGLGWEVLDLDGFIEASSKAIEA